MGQVDTLDSVVPSIDSILSMNLTLLLGAILCFLHLGDLRTPITVMRRGELMAISGDGEHTSAAYISPCDFPLPEVRFDPISVTTADGRTLVCGGAGPTKGPICWQFDYKRKVWRRPKSLILAKDRVSASAVSLASGTYVLGGSKQNNNSSEFLATGASKWTRGPDIPGRGVAQACAAKLNDTAFVVLGGWNDGHQARVFNEDTGKWTNWPSLKHWVARQSCVTLGDYVLMAGGYGGYKLRYTGRTIIFDSRNGRALEAAPLMHPRGLAGMGVRFGVPVIMGGYDGWVRRKDMEVFDMEKKKWVIGGSLKSPRHYLSVVNIAKNIDCN